MYSTECELDRPEKYSTDRLVHENLIRNIDKSEQAGLNSCTVYLASLISCCTLSGVNGAQSIIISCVFVFELGTQRKKSYRKVKKGSVSVERILFHRYVYR